MTDLYRHFDASGQLLYVGISLNAMVRTAQHRTTSPWFGEVTRIEIERFLTRQAASDAEKLAISSELPVYNQQYRVAHPRVDKRSRWCGEADYESARLSLKEALQLRGMVTTIAEAVSVTPGAVSQWERVPARHVIVVERVTGVARSRLRPDLYPTETSEHQGGQAA